eukprot:365661-Chlamydomonas_euryale.AAC.24
MVTARSGASWSLCAKVSKAAQEPSNSDSNIAAVSSSHSRCASSEGEKPPAGGARGGFWGRDSKGGGSATVGCRLRISASCLVHCAAGRGGREVVETTCQVLLHTLGQAWTMVCRPVSCSSQ